MLAILLKWITTAAVFGSLFFCSARDCAALLLVVWSVAIGILVCSNLGDRLLWLPVFLGLVGVFGSVFMLAIPVRINLAVNGITLAMFIVSLEILTKHGRSSLVVVKHRT